MTICDGCQQHAPVRWVRTVGAYLCAECRGEEDE